MILYENTDLSFVPSKWKALINIPNIIMGMSALGCIALGYIDNWGFFFWYLSFIVLISICIRLFVTRKARPIIIETLDNSLRIVYSKYFSVREVNIPNADVKIELYESEHRQRFGGKVYYLYFYSHTDSKIDIELAKDFYTLGKVLKAIHDEQKIQLGPKERDFVEKYCNQLEWNKSTKGKIVTTLYMVGIIAFLILLYYYFRTA